MTEKKRLSTRSRTMLRRSVVPGAALLAAATVLGNSPAQAPAAPKHGTNILLMGTDGRNTITAKEKSTYYAGGVACNCTDVMMLVHVSADRKRLDVVSMPRDSLAEIPAHRDASGGTRPAHRAKLNGAYAEGGPALTVRTVEKMTKVDVDGYVQVDFRRFMDSVDEVGGVEVCTRRRLQDSATRLDLAPGSHRLNGGRSLQYVRSRHVDASADLGRIQRQQRFLVSALRGLQDRGALRDRTAMSRLADTLLGSGRVDQGLGVGQLVDLAGALSRISPSASAFTTVPITGFNPLIPGVGSTLRWDDAKAKALFRKVREDRPLIAGGKNPKAADPPVFGHEKPVRGTALACP
ncbi:LCP family protein [Streptomyces sp. NPDC008313]|uniref:LCP family protein n=1 Tax=Streptomyces sp. NPDC008313 TaxID=3364826 RepID=UPI0036EE5FD3